MATIEERVDKMETRFTTLEQQVATVAAKVDMLVEESQQQREDRRAEQARHDADMKEMREDIKGTLRHIQGLTVASMVGIMAIAVGVLGFLWTTAKSMEPPTQPPAQSTQYQPTEVR